MQRLARYSDDTRLRIEFPSCFPIVPTSSLKRYVIEMGEQKFVESLLHCDTRGPESRNHRKNNFHQHLPNVKKASLFFY